VDDRIPEDPEIEELVSRALDPHRDFLSRVVGETSVGLNRNTILESTMDNFVLQSIISLGGAEVAFSNGWRYGAPVPPGPITVNDLYNMMPTNPLSPGSTSLAKRSGR
jgi:2',3'-cyclic-nucleotide 2'-phosphodiesterase (5'-nucleotidase family)